MSYLDSLNGSISDIVENTDLSNRVIDKVEELLNEGKVKEALLIIKEYKNSK